MGKVDADSQQAADSDLLDELVVANRILFNQGIVDAFGHVSVRARSRPDRYYLSMSIAPSLVTRDSILEFAMNNEPIDARGRPLYVERFIHGAIYSARPDVGAVVHSHSPTVVPFSVVPSVKLRAVCHTCAFLGSGVPNFDIRNSVGSESDLLIRDQQLGDALAQSLAGAAVVLMRGHGSTVVGPSLHVAVYRAIYTEINARTQSQALHLGEVVYLTEEESLSADAINRQHVTRPWDLWKSKVNMEGMSSESDQGR